MSQICSEKSELVTVQEIKPYDTKEMLVDYQCPFLHSELAATVKQMVTAALKKAEITARGEISITFQLPPDCVASKVDMDKIAQSYRKLFLSHMDGKNNLTCQFSFSKRLKGWNIERRQREDGTYDVLYRHSKSRKMFRYIAEVVNFLLYEIYFDDHASTLKRKRKSASGNYGWTMYDQEMLCQPKFEAFIGDYTFKFGVLLNEITDNMFKTLYNIDPLRVSNKPKRVMKEGKQEDIEESRKRDATKGQDFLITEENSTKMGATQRVHETLIKDEQGTVELQPDGSLTRMIDILKNVELPNEEAKSESSYQLQNFSTNWRENEAQLDTYFDECDLVYQIPVCRSVDELIDFLIINRNEMEKSE